MRVFTAYLLWILAALAGCGKDASPQPRSTSTSTPPAPAPDAATLRADCPSVPSAVPGTSITELDLDGDGAKDALVPGACDADGTCTWALFTVKAGCARALGTIAEVDRVEALPMTVNGIAVVRTLSASKYYRKEGVLAWSGSAWFQVFQATCGPTPENSWWCEATHASRLSTGDPAPEVPCVVAAAAPAPTLDLDRDGTPDTLVGVDCGAEFQSMCGTLVLRTHDACTRPFGFLPSGEVSIPTLGPKEPARILVQRPDPAGMEEQVELGPWASEEGFEVIATRTCDRDTCTTWEPPDRGAE